MLTLNCITPISGDFPKALAVFPDDKHFMTLNHETNEINTYATFYDKKFALMEGKPIKIDKPNCVFIHKLEG